MNRSTHVALLASLAMAPAAWAVPPPPGSAAAEELSHFSGAQREWISKQHDQVGRWCCSLGDFDLVTIDEADGKLRVKAKHPDKTRGIPDGWQNVPDDKRVDLTGQHSIPDVQAAWFYQGRVQCIIVGGGY